MRRGVERTAPSVRDWEGFGQICGAGRRTGASVSRRDGERVGKQRRCGEGDALHCLLLRKPKAVRAVQRHLRLASKAERPRAVWHAVGDCERLRQRTIALGGAVMGDRDMGRIDDILNEGGVVVG